MTGSSPGRGRPRSQSSRAAILRAAFVVLHERGFEGMAFEVVAAAAGVAKTTIYRWWKTRAELAVDSFFDATKAELTMPETESARDDFGHQARALARLLRGSRGRALASLLAASRMDDVLERAVQERWLAPRRAWGMLRIRRAIVEGQCRPNIDAAAALGLIYGSIYAPLLISGSAPSSAAVDAMLEIAFDGIFGVV